MKFTRQLVVSSLAVLVLSACSSSPAQRRQAKDDFNYLDTKPLRQWNQPQGTQPQFYANYNIPAGDFKGGIGQEVDIRPPQQVLELIPGARVEQQNNEVTLWMINRTEADKVWNTALKMAREEKIRLRQQSDDRIETDWVSWKSEDEDSEIGSRYEITREQANNRYGFRISLIGWRENGKEMPVSITNKERYNTLMTNLITARYDQDVREEAARRAQELIKHIPVTLGSDRSGLPVMIARAPFDVMWQRLPDVVNKMGFKIEDRSQSQGTVKVKYAAPDDEFWQSIGVKPVNLPDGVYTLLLGDLGNRTSINITDTSGKPVTEQLLKDMVPVLAAVMEK